MIFTIIELNFYKWKYEDKYCSVYAFNMKKTIIILTIMIITTTNFFLFRNIYFKIIYLNTCPSLKLQ